MDKTIMIGMVTYNKNMVKFGCRDMKGGAILCLTDDERNEVRGVLAKALQAKLTEIDLRHPNRRR